MNYWWVNQNQTYQHEVCGGYLWSPKANKGGVRNRFYDAMTETRPGDVVFSFCDTFIKAVGVVTSTCQSSPKPTEFGNTGDYWSDEGWLVPVRFVELAQPIKPKDHMSVLATTLPAKYSPLQPNGNGNQGVYLAPVPDAMATTLAQLLNGQVERIVDANFVDLDPDADHEQQRITNDATISETERLQIINARVGQGLFRSRVELAEPSCRVTCVSDRRFLRASHIKPWSKSSNSEKLDGSNGLMLAPHVDHLFDKGFISFSNDGAMLVSLQLPSNLLGAWGIGIHTESKPLHVNQANYMAFHRAQVFKK